MLDIMAFHHSLLGSGNFIISPTSVLKQVLNKRRIVKDKKYLLIFKLKK